MGFKERITKFVNLSEDDYYDDVEDSAEYDYDEDDYAEEDIPVKKSAFSSFRSAEKPRNNVVDFDLQSQQRSKSQVVVCKPATYDEATKIADKINQRFVVFLNLEATSREVAKRLVDFLAGAVYANNGNIRRIAQNIYIIAPKGCDISGEMLDSIGNTEMFFG